MKRIIVFLLLAALLRHADAGDRNARSAKRKYRRAGHGDARLVGAGRGKRRLLFPARSGGIL